MKTSDIELIDTAVSQEWNELTRLDEITGAYYRAAIGANYFGLAQEKGATAYAYQLEVLSLGREARQLRNEK
jgi:hypothetical protein